MSLQASPRSRNSRGGAIQSIVKPPSARVESAAILPGDLQSDVANRIKKIYGDRVDIAFGQNPALIGGLRVKVGSDVYDGSVRAKLERLAESF